jgi:hypothetical protein
MEYNQRKTPSDRTHAPTTATTKVKKWYFHHVGHTPGEAAEGNWKNLPQIRPEPRHAKEMARQIKGQN